MSQLLSPLRLRGVTFRNRIFVSPMCQYSSEEIIAGGKADAVLLARAFLRDPYWPQRAATELGAEVPWPAQYGRARRGK